MSSFLDILGITLLEGPTKDFGACIIAGLQFLRTILLHFDENREVYSKFHDSTSRSTYEGNRVLNQSSIQKALSKLYEEDIVAQLFKSWNSSHYELPQSREFLEFSWFAILAQARRSIEAEQTLQQHLVKYGLKDTIHWEQEKWNLTLPTLIAESMKKRKAYHECIQFFKLYEKDFFGSADWDFENAIRNLSTTIIRECGPKYVADAEELLILYILAINESANRPNQPEEHRTPNSTAIFRYFHRVLPSVLTFSLIYEESGLTMEAAKKDYSYRKEKYVGIYTLAKDERFHDACVKIRSIEEKERRVKTRFNDCLKRNDGSNFEKVDATWKTFVAPEEKREPWGRAT
ncbi:MAG: hypothetical protein LQ351_003436 [Letrouitia transgressa]|nr:MAG: hypothetical protein LQ351_003436 [Letrouitia transgressa]